MPGCDGKARNIESFCGPCSRAKRAIGQTVVNKGSPQNTATSQSQKKRPHERSAYEQGLYDRYALQCMSHCIQCLLQCTCFNMRRADTRICECTRSVILCVPISAKKHKETEKKAGKEARLKSKAGEFLTDQESAGIARYSHASSAFPGLHIY